MRRDHFIIVGSIAVGTALLACMLSSAFAVLIDPLPFPQANRIVTVYTSDAGSLASSSAPDYRDLAAASGPLSKSIFVESLRGAAEINGHPESVYSVAFAGDLFSVFQKPPIMGIVSDLNANSDRSIATALLTYSAWVRLYGADPHVLGRVVRIGTSEYEIRAVLPPEYQIALDNDFWVTSPITTTERGSRDGRIYARLDPGISLASVNAYLRTVSSSLQLNAPDTNEGITFEAMLLKDSLAGESRPLLYLLVVGACIVLAVVYFNAYQLLAARSRATSRRWSICLALGSTRKGLFREMLKEPLMLSLVGCSLGLLLSLWEVQVLRTMSPLDISRLSHAHLVWQASAVSFVFSILAAVVFALLTLARALKVEGTGVFHEGSLTGASIQHAFHAKKQSLLIAQIALSTALLISIGMVSTALHNLTSSSLGFKADGVSLTDLSLKQPTRTAAGSEFVDKILRSVAQSPSVKKVAAASSAPFQNLSYSAAFITDKTGRIGKEILYSAVSPDFFSALQTSVLRGRSFTEADADKNPKVAILNQAAAQMLFGDGDTLHHRLHGGPNPVPEGIQVVGVVENIRQDPSTIIAPPIVYLPLAQTSTYSVALIVRSDKPIGDTVIKSRVWAVSANQAVQKTVPLSDLITSSLRRIRYLAFLMTLFTAVTMALCALGIFAAVAQWLATSHKEVALRLALGATYLQIRNSILTRIMGITGIALVIGFLISLGSINIVKSLLFGVKPEIGGVFALSALILAAVAFLSGYLPSLRSKFIAPAELLRSE